MDILEARKRARQAKEAANASQPPTPATAPLPTASAASAESIPASVPAASPAVSPAPSSPRAAPGGEHDAGRAKAPVREAAKRTARDSDGLALDPLREFLALYDEGVHVQDEAPTGPVAAVDEDQRYLTFDLEGETYAASIMDVREISRLVSLTEVPRAPREVIGVTSKRGTVMPVVDLAAILGLRQPDATQHREQRVLVVGAAETICGLRVDRVLEVVRLPARSVEEVPASLGNKNAHMLTGLGRALDRQTNQTRMFILLDIEAVLRHLAVSIGVDEQGAGAGSRGTARSVDRGGA